MNLQDKNYYEWLSGLKKKIISIQLKAVITVNSALIQFYWELGKTISEKEKVWGSKLLESLSKDLQKEFPDMRGFSVSNLKTCRLFYQYFSSQPVNDYKNEANRLSSQPVNQIEYEIMKNPVIRIPWGHIKLLITKIKNKEEANFYIIQTIENNWSRDTLALQIKNNLYIRSGKAVSNFQDTLPQPLSDLAQQTLKDPYIFDFMALSALHKERDIEKQLIQHITKFLLELGKGFAFIAQQYHLEIANNDYFIDLLFYHTKLKCFVVVELKNTKFVPEYAGKLNFYLSAVDSLVKSVDDKPTIGILLCRDKNNIEAEFALRDLKKPIGVSEFQITEILPENFKTSLPTIEEIEEEMKKLEE